MILDSDKALSKQFVVISQRLLRFAESCLQNIPHWDRKLLHLSWSIGDFYSKTGDLYPALQIYELMERMATELIQANPKNVDLLYDHAVSYSKLGSTHSSLGNLSKALEYFEERSRLGEELYRSYPDNVSLKNGLAIAHWKLGDFYREKQKNPQQARHYFQLAEQYWSELVELAPDYTQFK